MTTMAMLLTLELNELKETLTEAARVAVAEYRRALSPADDLISQREAYERFQEVRVRRWRNDCLIRASRSGPARNSKIQYSLMELLALDAAEKLRPILSRRTMAPQDSRLAGIITGKKRKA